MKIQNNIKQIAGAQGVTLAEIAARLNITYQTLYTQLTGSPRLDTLEKIAGALHVAPWIILHPAPLSVLEDGQPETGTQAPGHPDSQAPRHRAICPHCKKEFNIFVTAAGIIGTEAGPEQNNKNK